MICETIVSTDAIVILVAEGCQPSSIGSLSFSNMYLANVMLAFPSVTSPNPERKREYSISDGVFAKVELNSGFVAAPYWNLAVRSAAATAN